MEKKVLLYLIVNFNECVNYYYNFNCCMVCVFGFEKKNLIGFV